MAIAVYKIDLGSMIVFNGVIVMQTKYEQEYIKFGLKVQYYRKLRGLTQEAFADKAGISWSYLAKIESPTRAFGVSMEKLFAIADALEVPVAKLFED